MKNYSDTVEYDFRSNNHIQSIKEIARHAMFRLGFQAPLLWIRRKRGFKTQHLQSDGLEDVFGSIYDQKVWVHSEGQNSLSGVGSETNAASALLAELNEFVDANGINAIVDVGCGDWNWMKEGCPNCKYIGVDVARSIVEANQKHSDERTDFVHLNACKEELPACDAVLCREVLFHLSFADARKLIANATRSAKYVLFTCDTGHWFNSDIPSGDFRPLNLLKKPFGFPRPDAVILDDAVVANRIIGIWESDRLKRIVHEWN